MEKANGKRDQEPALVWLIAGLLLVVLIGFFDFAAPPSISMAPLYLAAILVVVHRTGLWPGIVLALASGVASYMGQPGAEQPDLYPWVPYWNSLAGFVIFVLTAVLYGKLRTYEDQSAAVPWVDSVSGAGNAQYFYKLAEGELNRARRYNRPFSVAYLDVDHLRTVNDQFGRMGGDTLLSLVARTVVRDVRKSDVLARVGGDEFALLLPETGAEAAEIVVRRVHSHLVEIFEHDGWPVTLAVGVTTFNAPPESVEAAVKEAESLMYTAKQPDKSDIRFAAWGPPVAA